LTIRTSNPPFILRQRLVKAATWAALVVAAFLVISKSFAWYITDSLSIKASLVDSLLDAFASMINFVAVRHALRPADAEHQFGHGKVEALASLAQALFISLSSLWLMHEVVMRLCEPTALRQSSLAMAVMISSTILTGVLILGQRYVIKRTNSLAVSADALHYQTDILTNIAVLASFALSSYLHLVYFDTFMGAAIAVYILFASWKISKKSFDILMDRELPDEMLVTIRRIAQGHPHVLGIHDLRTRSSGHNEFIQMHLDLEASLTLDQAHHIADEVARQIYKVFPAAEVIIHQDPVGRCRHYQHKPILP